MMFASSSSSSSLLSSSMVVRRRFSSIVGLPRYICRHEGASSSGFQRNRNLLQQSKLPLKATPLSLSSKGMLREYSTTFSTSFSRNGKSDDNSDELNRIFIEQMKELEEEREQLFGNVDDISREDDTPQKLFDMYQQRQQKPQDDPSFIESKSVERDQIYDFTAEERTAWSNFASASEDEETQKKQQNSSADMLEAINEARTMIAQAKQSAEEDMINNILQQKLKEQQQEQQKRDEKGSLTEQVLETKANIAIEEKDKPALTHLSDDGTSVNMVDIGEKATTRRTAKAQTKVILPTEVLNAMNIQGDNNELVGPKGPIFTTAKLAGISAAKRTSDLIPLCHPLPLDKVKIDIRFDENNKNVVIIDCECRVTHKTGVEMEALTGATIAALTIYDMTKAISHNIRITETKLIGKTGGKRTVGPTE